LYQHPDANSLGEVNVIIDGTSYGTPVSIQDSTLTINFDTTKFVAGKSVTIQISPFNVYVVNEDGLGFDAFTWSFTSFKPNPVLVSSNPLDNATKVSLSDSLVFNYNQNITLKNAALISISDGINSFAPSFVRVLDDKSIVGPNGFTNGTTYTVTVDSGAIVNEFDLANSKTELTFRTIMSAPVVSSLLPLANQQRVALGSPIQLSLNQSVKVTDVLEVSLTAEGVASISGVRASLTDTLLTLSGFTLENATNYSVDVKSGSLINEDSVANSAISWNFRTIMAAPIVTEVSPANESEDIATNGTAVVRFSQEITLADASKVSFSPAVTDLSLSTSCDSLVIAYTNLQAITTYTVTVESGAIVNEEEVTNTTKSWSFTTLIAPPAAPELVSPDSAAINQAITGLSFTWNTPQYAETYQIQISDLADFSSLIEDATNLSVTTLTPTMSLEYFKTHFWRVKAFNKAGESDWSVVYRLTTVPAAPSQVFPQMAQTEISTAPLIKWNSAHTDVRFNLVVASDTSLTTVLKDTMLNQSEYQFFGLNADTKYFWTVRVNDERGTSAWSDTRVFLMRQDPVVTEDKDVDVTFDFGSTSGSTTTPGGTPTEKTKPQQTDYSMVSLPGTDGIRVDAFFKTEYKKTWRAFIETGDPLNFYNEYTPEDNRFVFTPGIGFWVLSTEIVADVRKFTSVNTNENDSYAIPVHAGWNIIGNPYQSNVDWKLTLAFNSKQSCETVSGDLWGYEKAFIKTDTLKPLKGYYFYNDPNWSLDTLYLPYTGFDQRGQDEQLAKDLPAETPVLTATATYEDGNHLDVNWVFAKSSALEMDIMRRHPMLDFVQQGMILTDKNDKSVGYVRQESELIEDGTAYELELKARRGSTVLWKSVMENLPQGTKLLLVNQITKLNYMVGSEEEIKLKITEPKSLFDVYIGSEQYLQEVKECLLPGEFTLMQNYPNPFNPTTVIRYGLKEAGMVKLEVFDILGRRVQTLVNKNMQPGWYIVDFNAVNLSSGVYLYRLQSGNQVKVHKMVLVK